MAKDASLRNKWPNAAIIEVDPQKGFSELCPSELPVEGALEIVESLNEQAEELGVTRIVTRDFHPADALWMTNDRAMIGKPIPNLPSGSNMDLYWPPHCVAGTPGCELLPGLPPIETYDYVVSKGAEPDMHPYGAAYLDLAETISSGLIEYLRLGGIEIPVLGGLVIEHCIPATALQLNRAGFRVVVNLSACRGISKATSEAAIAKMKKAGIRIARDIKDVKKYFRSQGS